MSDVNQRTEDDDGLSIEKSVKTGYVPVGMRVTVDLLASFLGKDSKTINRWMNRYQLPCREIAGNYLIDTDEWWNALPRRIYDSDESAEEHGEEPTEKGEKKRKR